MLGAVLGALFVATIQDGFTLLKVYEFWKIFFKGFAIVAAVTIDALVTQRLQEALRRRRRAEVLEARTSGGGSVSARRGASPVRRRALGDVLVAADPRRRDLERDALAASSWTRRTCST